MGRGIRSHLRLDARLFTTGTWAGLAPRARLILPLIVLYIDRSTGIAFVGQRKLQELAGLGSQRTVARAVEDLVREGVIERVTSRGRRTEYRLSEKYLKSAAPQSAAVSEDGSAGSESPQGTQSGPAPQGASLGLVPGDSKCVTSGHEVSHSGTKVRHSRGQHIHKKNPERSLSRNENSESDGGEEERMYSFHDLDQATGLTEWLEGRR
jgi:hypothetical protein